MSDLYCEMSSLEIQGIEVYGKPYISFLFCCRLYQELMIYPMEEVINNLDYYIEKCYNIYESGIICEKCQMYNGYDYTDRTKLIFQNNLHIVCRHLCTYCCARQTVLVIKTNEYLEAFLEAVLKTKKILKFTPSNSGEPFDNDYIKNNFLFRVHESSIRSLLILSNGIHLDKDYIERFYNYCKKHNITVWFGLNVSGFNKKTYESYCTGKFETMKTNVKLLSEYFGPENVSIIYVVSDHNLEYKRDEIEKQFTEIFPFLDPERNLNCVLDYVKLQCNEYNIPEMKKQYIRENVDDRVFEMNIYPLQNSKIINTDT